ncbi:MAG: class I SAM-dependent methyltransferase [Dehalococcoidia bacterium]|nr:class I SAM-dependent methyltransferase [Dehalococcoidia bacterium]
MTSSIMYRDFARFYARGDWPRYSSRMASMLPGVLEHFGLWPRNLLDLACGEGTFAVAMAKRGLAVTGIDLSPEMLDIARERAEKEGLDILLLQQDMRSLHLRGKFDLVTCWFDSLNYLLEIGDLVRTFAGVSRVLDQRGIFIFDMNTIRALSTEWISEPCYVHLDSRDVFLASVPKYDPAARIASLHIMGFSREDEGWVRVDEIHRERGYTLKEVRQCLRKAGLREMACWASLDRKEKPRRSSVRVWFVAGRQPEHARPKSAAA